MLFINIIIKHLSSVKQCWTRLLRYLIIYYKLAQASPLGLKRSREEAAEADDGVAEDDVVADVAATADDVADVQQKPHQDLVDETPMPQRQPNGLLIPYSTAGTLLNHLFITRVWREGAKEWTAIVTQSRCL